MESDIYFYVGVELSFYIFYQNFVNRSLCQCNYIGYKVLYWVCLLQVRFFKFNTKCDVPQSWEDPIVTLVPSGQGQSVPSIQVEVKAPGAKWGDPAWGLEVAGPVLWGLNPLAVDMNESLLTRFIHSRSEKHNKKK